MSSTGMTDMPIEISYEIICALERMPRTSDTLSSPRSREHDAIHAHRDDAECVVSADVQVRDDHLLIADDRAERNHATVSIAGITETAGARKEIKFSSRRLA